MGASSYNAQMQHQASTNARRHAITLRIGMTDAERRLWSRLRSEQLGVKFRRQHRFWANEVLSQTDAVVSCIVDVLVRGPHPDPPPAGEGDECLLSPAGQKVKNPLLVPDKDGP